MCTLAAELSVPAEPSSIPAEHSSVPAEHSSVPAEHNLVEVQVAFTVEKYTYMLRKEGGYCLNTGALFGK